MQYNLTVLLMLLETSLILEQSLTGFVWFGHAWMRRGTGSVEMPLLAREIKRIIRTSVGTQTEHITRVLLSYSPVATKVRSLEQQNKLLEMEIEALKNRYLKPSGLRLLYEEQLQELKRLADQMRVQQVAIVIRINLLTNLKHQIIF